ncbi:hypothetical protein TREMEDRAFT_58282 [Tremella mesenterica DSM 1558]|uniref:uncharacterized protein n=1 Tax=Tremella mesenterica (strain ATCC 24925 / CBS 8224 / DSM 1558 / NBRC 9311 / NRRL Y-6157 / RJB 2259-6 / UBC 559-6) TaxID=578456 RepID=UPI0003F4A626|nr:uncharacterized protein TREMEDRAFT_58282 [Tremella mesenterica DSM 1558]EIW72126.1 hypothetical protein TREMEDRAFT_58282 [Tremella mesenterica DSM 1558]
MSPDLALEIRLRTIEAIIYGVPSHSSLSFTSTSNIDSDPGISHLSPTEPHKEGEIRLTGDPKYTRQVEKSSISLTRRIKDVMDVLERTGGHDDGIKRLLDGYDQYLPLLQPGSEAINSDSESLPDHTKLIIVLEASEDIKESERGLREIDLLISKGVDGSGELQKILPLKPEIVNAQKSSISRMEELRKVREEVNNLLRRYSTYTNTVSEMFIELHNRTQTLEDAVTRLERKKKEELESRY